MLHLISTFFSRIKSLFSLRLSTFLAGAIALIALWFFAQFVLAEKEASIYIFPSNVTEDGWERPEASLGQDLSSDALLVDFTQENSARVFFGKILPPEDATNMVSSQNIEPFDFDTQATSTTQKTDDYQPIDEPFLSSSTNATTGQDSTSSAHLQEIATPVSESKTETLQIAVPEAHSSQLVQPATSTSVESTSSSTQQTMLDRIMRGLLMNIFTPRSVLALEAPTSTNEILIEPLPTSSILNQFVPMVTNILNIPKGTTSQLRIEEQSPVEFATTSILVTNGNAPSVSSSSSRIDTIPNNVDGIFEFTNLANTTTQHISSSSKSIIDFPLSTGTTSTGTSPLATPVRTVESNDPYSVALCTTFGRTCHIMTYDGFGLGGVLDENPLVAASIELSFSGRGAFTAGDYDRVIVRAYHAGHWQYLGATELRGEVSNGKLGGYISYELPDIVDWTDLSDLRVVVEYDRVSGEDASAYVDGIWVNARYANDSLNQVSPDSAALSGVNIRSSLSARDAEARKARRDELVIPSGGQLTFVNQQEYTEAKLSLKTDREVYHALGEGLSYFNVTNEGENPEVVRLQFHFPDKGSSIKSVSQFVHNVPYKVGQLKYDDIGYFCEGGWEAGSSTGAYYCPVSDEIRSCDLLNTDRSNCISEGSRIGLSEGVEYRDGWEVTPLTNGSITDSEGLFAKAINLLFNQLPDDVIPSTISPIAHLAESVVLLPGQTLYFKANFDVPLNSRGDFYIEAAAESGNFGLVRATWDGSWNYRMQVTIDNERVNSPGKFSFPFSLDNAPEEFWQHVASDGSDLRFVDEKQRSELPYWITSFDGKKRTGLVWVRANNMDIGSSTTVAMYYGLTNSVSRSNSAAPFRSDDVEPRGIIFGGSQSDMSLHVIALDDNIRVSIPNHPEALLKYGESALFDQMKPGTIVSADGPITASVEAPGASAKYVPVGYAGNKFILPGIGGERNLSVGIAEQGFGHTQLGSAEDGVRIDPVLGSIVTRGVYLEKSTLLKGTQALFAMLGTDNISLPTPLYPATNNDLYGFQVGKSMVGIGDNATALTVACDNEARQSVDGRLAGAIVKTNSCDAGGGNLVGAVRLMNANNDVSLIDVVGTDFSIGLPRSEFSYEYIFPSDSAGVSVICSAEDSPNEIGVFDPQGGLVASSTCGGRGVYPGKTHIASARRLFNAGFSIRSISRDLPKPFMAAIAPSQKSVSITEKYLEVAPLISPQLSRTIGTQSPHVGIGEEEFVIPGEHRKLDIDVDGREKSHVDTLLTKDREFSMRESPSFRFQYKRQSNTVMRGVRDVFGMKPFTVSNVLLKHSSSNDIPVDYEVAYNENNEWSLVIKDKHREARPGKYVLHIEIEEGGKTYIDEYDFYWGVLAINFNKSVFTPGEKVDISIGALSNNGNTLCEANLKLWITDVAGSETEVPVVSSGLCDGNNVVDKPDYSASYQLSNDIGIYTVKLVRLDENENIASQVSDSFAVREQVPYSIERIGPTRIYPIAHYPMKIRVHANEAFEGTIVERVPGDFVFIDRGNANLEWGDEAHSFLTASWGVKLAAGASIDLQYIFDAPNRSPDLFLLGPAEIHAINGTDFNEQRQWQIASDAAGKMMLFYDNSGGLPAVPAGWSCVSCLTSDPFFERLVVGSSSYNGLGGGTATHTPTSVATVNITNSTGVGPNSTISNTNNAPLSHTHTLTPTISSVSNYPLFRDLRVIQYNSAGDPGTIPAGAIGVFDVASSSLPIGWYRYSALDGRYARSQTSMTSSGGANTHSHTVSGTTSVPPQSGLRSQNGVINGATSYTHTHALASTSTNVANNEPPYAEVLFARLPVASSTPVYLISMWDDAPPTGWVHMSDPGQDFAGKFLKGTTTKGQTGGGTSHAHANITGAVTGVTASLNNYSTHSDNAQAPAAHIHTVDISGFSDDSQIPPYVDVIFAKSFSGIPIYTQNSFQFYANVNTITPTDPWPPGGSDYSENTPITAASDSVSANTQLRLRMSVGLTNATTSAGAQAFKLQYVSASDCAAALNWTDVAAIGATNVPWRGYDNSGVTNNTTLPSTLLTSSTIEESYVEANNSAANPNEISKDGVAEWDWVLEQQLATSSSLYCFRMVLSDGSPLDGYTTYPQILTNAEPNLPTLSSPFSFEKIGTTTPSIQFSSVDTESNNIDYQIQISFSATFTSSIISTDSLTNPELFNNLTNPTNKAPFNSSDNIEFKPVLGTLTNGLTYWWRTRAKDTNNSNTWSSWSSEQSFTIDTTVAPSTWHQTTRDQFNLNTLFRTATSNDNVVIASGFTTGTMTSPIIDFSLATVGTAWGSLSFVDDETVGDVKYHIEYLNSGGAWVDIPDSVLSGNVAGFDTSPVSLLNVDPANYSAIRIRADLTSVGGTPVVNDWTITWGYKVDTPALYLPFDNQKVATRTPYFEFMATDPQSDDLVYEIQWSTTASFVASTTRDSASNLGFQNLTIPADISPFTSGSRIRFTIQGADQLASSTTYYWRVRAVDPSGSQVFSFWSDVHSITVDTTVQVSTWFQTDNDQFLSDTLTSMRSYANGSSTVSTSTDEIMLAYAEGIVQTPRYRIYDGTTLGAEQSALSVSAAINWVILKASALGNQYILGTLGSDNDTNFQVYDSGSWGNLMELGVNAPSSQRRSFDVAFESVSGRAITVSCNSSSNPDYRIWDGGAWATTGVITLGFTSNCEWVRLASNPQTNEIIGLFRDTGSQYEAQVWNATTSTWGNSMTQGSMNEIAHEGMAVEYNASGTLAMVVTSDGRFSRFAWNTWNGSAWSGATTQSIGDDFEFGNLRRNKFNNDITLCYIDEDEDVGVTTWNGTSWNTFVEQTQIGTSKTGRPTDCIYETTSGRSNYILNTYSETGGTFSRFWNTAVWSAQTALGTLPTTFTNQLVRSNASGKILGLFFDHIGTDYEYAEWTGSTWTNQQTIETNASVTVAPYGEPFFMAAQFPATSGTIISTPIDFDDGNSPAWSEVLWDVTKPGASTFKVQVQYQNQTTGVWALIPDSDLSGNAAGFSTSPLAITSLNTITYNVIRLKGSAVCVSGSCPFLNDWTVKWAAGLRISGTARQHDLTSLVTSGTVGVAVNGAIQTGKTGAIDASGNWFIDNVTVFSGGVLTVFIDGAADVNEAVNVSRYTGPGDSGGIRLAERWLSIGSASTTGQTISLLDIGLYDNSVSGDEDIFFDVDASGDYYNCVTGTCSDSSIDAYANTFNPSTTTAKTINTWDMRTSAYFYAGANTIKVGGDWKNLGGFTANTSTIVFNGVSSTRTIDSTGAATSTFYNVTFGESGNLATWNFSSAFVATGTVAMSYGTISPGAYAMTLQGDLTIGASGTFQKGTATTTFSGATAKTWTDSTAAKQDLGNILIDGTAKTLTLGSSVKASAVKIGADDILNAGGANTLTVLGFWENTGTFTAQTGTVTFATTTASLNINQGTSNFYNLTFSGAGGSWRWLNTNATATNNVTISAGTITLPGGTLSVGGSFDNSGGTFVHNSGALRFTSTATGKNIRLGGSDASTVIFAGSGGTWSFLDTNATATQDVTIISGTPTFPSGTFAIGHDFVNQSGAFTANSGTIKMTSTLAGRTITLLNSSLASLLIANSGTFTITDTNATATADVTFAAGTTILPTGTLAVGGSFSNSGVFTVGNQVTFNPISGAKTVNPGNSSFVNVSIVPSTTATVNITNNATTTAGFTIATGNFTQSSGTTLAVGGTFTNQTGGASTTWAGSILHLNSGTTYTLNTKTVGADVYGTLKLSAGTKINMWGSSATTYEVNAAAYLYSQNHGGVSGELDIFGAYARTSGTEYWSAQTDFDGTALATSSHRAVAVRFDSGASATFTNSSLLQILGTSTATTTIDYRSSGTYALTVSSSTINANYYQLRNMNATGLYLTASTTISSLDYGDVLVSVAGGSGFTFASSTVNQNASLQVFRVGFSTTTAISAYNITELGDPTSSAYIRFKEHYGNLAGEEKDNDPKSPDGNPGYIRWDDSNFVISVSGAVYAGAGAPPMGAPTCDDSTPNVRVKVDGLGDFAAACSSADGSFTVPGVTFSGDTVMTIYLDTNGGTRAVFITRTAAADLSNIKLYQDRVIVSHEDVIPMTIAGMDAYDGGDDSDIPFVATIGSPNTLVVNPETEFWIWDSKTFIPGGNITLNSGGSGNNWDGSFHIDNNAVFTAQGTESHSVGGKWTSDSGAIFTAASSTFTFTATTSGKAITALTPVTFWNTVFNGSGGNWSINQTVNVGNTMTVTAGTVSGANSVTVSGNSVTGDGAILLTGGTFTFANGGTFGGSTDWSFNNLTLGSGGVGTTTKTASSAITVGSVLTISSNHVLDAGTSTTWVLNGSGTPFVKTGTFDANNSVFRYDATAATNVTAATYSQLEFTSSGAGTPTYTLLTGTLTVGRDLVVGDSSHAITVNTTTNDPVVSVLRNIIITSGANLVGSDSALLNLYGNWTNGGTFTHSAGTVMLVATTTGKNINAGSSAFGSLIASSTAGGWTITSNATTASAFSIIAANSFTQAPGTTLEVNGVFTNSIGGAPTTWTNSRLYLNSGTAFQMNASTTGADTYGVLEIGGSTKAAMWNSSAATTTVSGTGSLYSQDHAMTDGLLYIWGNYTKSTGTDYWSYARDFDGTVLSGGNRRQANVLFATSAVATISGTGALEVVGADTSSTTLDVMSAGTTYALNISGGSTTMRYLSVRGTDVSGVNFSGSPVVNVINDVDFLLAVEGGAMITVAGATINTNPLKIFDRNYFNTSTGITTGFNVKATGVSASIWRFAGDPSAYGNYSGEAHDNDPGGDPGYIVWDDSAAQITISGNVYNDEGVTPIGGPTCDGVTQNVRLRIQGAGSYVSACDASTGAFSISNIVFNPGDALTLYLDTNGGAKAANISLDPTTNIANMHLYQNRVIVRHEQANPISISVMDAYDGGQDADIPFIATLGAPNTLSLSANTKLIVWTSKNFAPGGNVTIHGNAGSGIDGSVELYATSTWSSAGSETHTVAGQFLARAGAAVSPANSTFNFNATSSGKFISASTSLAFYNLTFSGANGTWDIGGVSTSSNDISMTAGTTTLPLGVLDVGGTFDANGGVFANNSGIIRFTSTATGKNIRSSGSDFYGLEFRGIGGGWTFLDTNATATAGIIITAGTPVLPVGTLAIGTDFDNQSGAFTANGGMIKMTATSTGRIVRGNGSSFSGITMQNDGSFTFVDTNATATGDVYLLSGSTTLPTLNFVIGGNFIATSTITAGTSTITFNPSSGTKTLTFGTSTLYNVNILGTGGATVSIATHATTTNAFTILSGNFTLASGKALAVGGQFSNLVGGVPTTWTGSTLSLYSGTSYSMNTKSAGADLYATLRISTNTYIRSWNSSAGTYEIPANASVYSQNHAAVSGALNIYGTYVRSTGTDYWSYATDFDGVALGGSSRQANVRLDANATAMFSTNASLEMVGISTASTTVDRISSGIYGVTIDSSTLNANYYQFRNLDTTGLYLSGTTTIVNFNNGDFELATNGGSLISIASTTIDQNASAIYDSIRFATTTAIGGANVSRIGTTTTSAINFTNEYGNMGYERYDNDGNDACGSIRFTDSACLFSDQKTYRWRNDDGAEGALATEWYSASWSKRQRVRITNNSTSTVTNAQVKMNVLYDSDMQSNFNDLRFTDSSGTTSIPYWIESYISSGTSTVWVKVPTLAASAVTDIFVYYGNGSATTESSGTSTFKFFDDFEDNNITEYTGDTSLFNANASYNYERSYGLSASAGNTASQNTSGIWQSSSSVGRDTTFRFYQYIDMSTGAGDEPCFIFAVQSPITAHQNYGICLSPFGLDKVTISKNVVYNARSAGATELATTTVTYSTGWYQTSVDWLTNNQINVTVYDSTGAVFATTSAADSTYTTGGVGFTFWGMHGGWDIPSARQYISSAPTVSFGLEQADSGATWKAAENTILLNQLAGQNVRLRLTVRNSGTPLSDQRFRLQVAAKLTSPNCESVPTGSYSDVTPSSACGTSPACMSASTQFTDKASTTQLLPIPTGQTFEYGQIIKDTSIETGPISLDSSVFTEVEYNFQMSTAYAVQNAYCFRTTNSGTALDNYSKVAELTVRHAPVVSNFTFNGNSNIALTEGTSTIISATATISDLNGYADIVAATSTFYRSSVSGGADCASDQNNCYQIASTSCSLYSCSGNSCEVSCSASMKYFADPTDFGSIFESDIWQAALSVWDTSLAYANTSATQDLLTVRGLNASSSINYGSIIVGNDSGSTAATTTVNNTGNTILNMDVGGDPLTSGASSISYSLQKFSTSTFNYSTCGAICTSLTASTSPTYFPIAITKPTSTSAFFKDIYWGIAIPLGTSATPHSGINYFTAQ